MRNIDILSAFVLILFLLLFSCSEDETCDGNCEDGDIAESDAAETDSDEDTQSDGDIDVDSPDSAPSLDGDNDRENEETEQEKSDTQTPCQEDSECEYNEYCRSQTGYCTKCGEPIPDEPFPEQDAWCRAGNVIAQQGAGEGGPHCTVSYPPISEGASYCPEGTLCASISESYINPNQAIWAECRESVSPDWENGIAGEWSESGAFVLEDVSLPCSTREDCFDASNTEEVKLFACTAGQCYGCPSFPDCREVCLDENGDTNYMEGVSAKRCQWSKDEFGCPIVREITFACPSGSRCKSVHQDELAPDSYFGDYSHCVPIEE